MPGTGCFGFPKASLAHALVDLRMYVWLGEQCEHGLQNRDRLLDVSCRCVCSQMIVGVVRSRALTRRCGKSSAQRRTARRVTQHRSRYQYPTERGALRTALPGQAVLARGLPNEADPSELRLLSFVWCMLEVSGANV